MYLFYFYFYCFILFQFIILKIYLFLILFYYNGLFYAYFYTYYCSIILANTSVSNQFRLDAPSVDSCLCRFWNRVLIACIVSVAALIAYDVCDYVLNIHKVLSEIQINKMITNKRSALWGTHSEIISEWLTVCDGRFGLMSSGPPVTSVVMAFVGAPSSCQQP